MPEQLTLKGVTLKANATFDNFIAGQNQHLVTQLKQFASKQGEQYIYIWGSTSFGKSHLLQAICHYAEKEHLQAFYLPLQELKSLPPSMLDDLENLDIICVDDIDCVAKDRAWEEGLFHLYNRLKAANSYLIVAANKTPKEIDLSLADLTSRLNAGVTFHIEALNDEEKIQALQLSAKTRGFGLPEEVAKLLLHRCSRNMKDLFVILDKLDTASLMAQRKLTVPFVKSVLEI